MAMTPLAHPLPTGAIHKSSVRTMCIPITVAGLEPSYRVGPGVDLYLTRDSRYAPVTLDSFATVSLEFADTWNP